MLKSNWRPRLAPPEPSLPPEPVAPEELIEDATVNSGGDLLRCIGCSGMVARDALECTHCGYQRGSRASAQRLTAKKIALGVVGTVGALVIVSVMASRTEVNDAASNQDRQSAIADPKTDASADAASDASAAAKAVTAETNELLSKVKSLPAADLEANRDAYSRLAELNPSVFEYAHKRTTYAMEVEDAANFQKEPYKALKVARWNWNKDGFGSIMMIDLTIENKARFAIKDFEVQCIHSGPSGTEIDRNTRTVYDTVPANGSKKIRQFNMGFIANQASSSRCEIVDASKA